MGLLRKGAIGAALSVIAVMFMSVQAFAAPPTVDRLWGVEAADTAAAISQRSSGTVGGAVVLARDDDYMDAMSATGLAGALGASILVTNTSYLSDAAAGEIARLQPSTVYIIGGEKAIHPEVEAALGAREVVRVFGTEACDTSVACAKIIEHLNEQDGIAAPGGPRNAEDTAIVATSVDFADALSVSSYAYKYRIPIFIVGAMTADPATDRKLPATAVEMLADYGSVLVPGGTAALPDASLAGYKGEVLRVAGTTGYDTSLTVAQMLVARGKLSGHTVGIASGDPAPKGVDALASASLCALNDAALILVDKDATMTSAAYRLLGFGESLSRVYVFGGSAVVSSAAFEKVCNLLGSESVDSCPTSTPEQIVSSPEELVSLAASCVGRRYEAGGTGPDAFDCSGFVYWVFNECGYNLPRRSAEGYHRLADGVSPQDARPGDVVFYPDDKGYIFHVAIYAGNGRVYEALNESTGVVSNPVDFCGPTYHFGRLAPRPYVPGGGYWLCSYGYNGQRIDFCSVCWEHVAQEEFRQHLQTAHGL